MSIEGGLAGLSLDITALYTPDNNLPQTVPPATALQTLLEAKVPLESITMSSDGNSVQPYRDKKGNLIDIRHTPANSVAKEIAKAVLRDNMALEVVLPLATTNAAKRLRIDHKKGSLTVGKDADVAILDRDMNIDTVYSNGKLVLKKKEPLVRGYLEDL